MDYELKLNDIELQYIRAALRTEIDSLQQAIDDESEIDYRSSHITIKKNTGELLIKLSKIGA